MAFIVVNDEGESKDCSNLEDVLNCVNSDPESGPRAFLVTGENRYPSLEFDMNGDVGRIYYSDCGYNGDYEADFDIKYDSTPGDELPMEFFDYHRTFVGYTGDRTKHGSTEIKSYGILREPQYVSENVWIFEMDLIRQTLKKFCSNSLEMPDCVPRWVPIEDAD